MSGCLIGIDYGTKRIGIAVSDYRQFLASPLNNYQRNGIQADERYFKKLVAEYEPTGLVVGLPLHMNGSESQKSGEVRQFGQWLFRMTALPIAYHDERCTSVQAESLLLQAEMTSKQRKARLDKVAAQILLQAFLDLRRPPQPLTLDPVENTDDDTDEVAHDSTTDF